MLPPCHDACFDIEGRGRPVVLLHASMGSRARCRMLVERMRHSRRLITIDLHRDGGTPLPAEPDAFTLQRAAKCVESVLHVGLLPGERFHLVGHSHAAAVALHIAQARPRRLHSLTLFEAGPAAEQAAAGCRITVPTHWLRASAGVQPAREFDGFVRGIEALELPVAARVAVHG
jgi:pimeloyl-ACP methyl ester carboxylesterase